MFVIVDTFRLGKAKATWPTRDNEPSGNPTERAKFFHSPPIFPGHVCCPLVAAETFSMLMLIGVKTFGGILASNSVNLIYYIMWSSFKPSAAQFE